MSDVLAFENSSLRDEETAKSEKRGFVAFFKATMESLVAAQRNRFSDTEPLLYRFPPL